MAKKNYVADAPAPAPETNGLPPVDSALPPPDAVSGKVRTSFYLVFGYTKEDYVEGNRLAGMEVLGEFKSVRGAAKWISVNGAFLRRIYVKCVVLRCKPLEILP